MRYEYDEEPWVAMIWKETAVVRTTVSPITQEFLLRDWKKFSGTSFGSQAKSGTGTDRIQAKTSPFPKLYGNLLSALTCILHDLIFFSQLRDSFWVRKARELRWYVRWWFISLRYFELLEFWWCKIGNLWNYSNLYKWPKYDSYNIAGLFIIFPSTWIINSKGVKLLNEQWRVSTSLGLSSPGKF
jgi:hypothetical protein